MTKRAVSEYVDAYKIVRFIVRSELGYSNLSALKRFLKQEMDGSLTTKTIDKILSEGRRPGNSDAFFRAISRFMEREAARKKLDGTAEEFLARITTPLQKLTPKRDDQSPSYPDTPNHPGDGPNVSAPPSNSVEDLVQFDLLVSGDNWSSLGRFLLMDLYFGKTSIVLADTDYDLYLTRCQIRLTLDSALSDRTEERIFQDEKNPILQMKISSGQGTGRSRFWEVAHLDTNQPLCGTFAIQPLCKVEQELKPTDVARLIATPANLRVATSAQGATAENPEKQRVLEQLIKLRKLNVMRDGRIQFSAQRLVRR